MIILWKKNGEARGRERAVRDASVIIMMIMTETS